MQHNPHRPGHKSTRRLHQKGAHPDLNQGPADLQSAALTTELCTRLQAPRRWPEITRGDGRPDHRRTPTQTDTNRDQPSIGNDTLAEWLRRRPAKPMGFPRVGSNPTGVAPLHCAKRLTKTKPSMPRLHAEHVAQPEQATHMTPVGFEPTQLALVELESTPLDHSGKVSYWRRRMPPHYALCRTRPTTKSRLHRMTKGRSGN